MEEPHGSLDWAKHSGRELGWGGRGTRLFQGSGGPWSRGACLQVLEHLRCAADTWAITGVPGDLHAAPSHPQGWARVLIQQENRTITWLEVTKKTQLPQYHLY